MSRPLLNVILDLDQTLISAEELKKFDYKKYKKKMESFRFEVMDDLYIVFARPHLQEFLDYLFSHFNVSIWTAASKSYALFVIEKFILNKPNRKIDFIFFSYHCDFSIKQNKGLKGLKVLWEDFGLVNYNYGNTIIVDDNDQVNALQKCNCYHITPFHFKKAGSEHDEALFYLVGKLEALRTHLQNSSPTTKTKAKKCLTENM